MSRINLGLKGRQLLIWVLIASLVTPAFAGTDPKDCEQNLVSKAKHETESKGEAESQSTAPKEISDQLQKIISELESDAEIIFVPCQGNKGCTFEKSSEASLSALERLAAAIKAKFKNFGALVSAKSLRGNPYAMADFIERMAVVYLFQLFSLASYQYSKTRAGNFSWNDIHLDVFPHTFVMMWLQAEIGAKNTAGFKWDGQGGYWKTVLSYLLGGKKDFAGAASAPGKPEVPQDFWQAIGKAFKGEGGFWNESGTRLWKFLLLLPVEIISLSFFRNVEQETKDSFQAGWTLTDSPRVGVGDVGKVLFQFASIPITAASSVFASSLELITSGESSSHFKADSQVMLIFGSYLAVRWAFVDKAIDLGFLPWLMQEYGSTKVKRGIALGTKILYRVVPPVVDSYFFFWLRDQLNESQ